MQVLSVTLLSRLSLFLALSRRSGTRRKGSAETDNRVEARLYAQVDDSPTTGARFIPGVSLSGSRHVKMKATTVGCACVSSWTVTKRKLTPLCNRNREEKIIFDFLFQCSTHWDISSKFLTSKLRIITIFNLREIGFRFAYSEFNKIAICTKWI